MKKLIFLLLTAVIMAGFVSAMDSAKPLEVNPGGRLFEVLNLEVVLFGNIADICIVKPDAVLAEVVLPEVNRYETRLRYPGLNWQSQGFDFKTINTRIYNTA